MVLFLQMLLQINWCKVENSVQQFFIGKDYNVKNLILKIMFKIFLKSLNKIIILIVYLTEVENA